MVKLDCEKFLLGFVAAVLTFFIVGLLYLLCFKARRQLGSVQHPVGDRSSHPIWLHQLRAGRNPSSHTASASEDPLLCTGRIYGCTVCTTDAELPLIFEFPL